MTDIINAAMGEINWIVDGEILKAVQKVGISVDKDKLIEALQLADKMVYCKDCWKRNTGKCRMIHGERMYRHVFDYDFCSYGEREGE